MDKAIKYKKWPRAQWARTIFLNEKIFRVTNHRRGWFVTRNIHEKYHPCCISKAPKFGLQIHVLGAIGFKSKANLMLLIGNLNAVQYQIQILHDVQTLGKVCVKAKQPWVFMQDLAPPHNAGSTRQYLQNKYVKILDCSGN